MNRRHLLLLSALALTGCGDRKPAAAGGGGQTLRVGMDLTYPPFEFTDSQGNPDGVGARMAEALAADLGRPLKIVPMSFAGLLGALETGSVDCVISSMTASDERRKTFDFSDPYAWTAISMLVQKESPVQKWEDLKEPGRKVAVKKGTTAETWARGLLPDNQIIVFEPETACVEEVKSGRAAAFVYDQLSILNFHKANPDTTRALLQPIREESWAVAIRKGDTELAGKVNAFIAKFRKEGGFEKLALRYLAEEKKTMEALGIPFILR